MAMTWDPVFGFSCQAATATMCSRCSAPLPEDDVPFMLFGSVSDRAWVYGSCCETHILQLCMVRGGFGTVGAAPRPAGAEHG